MSQGSSGTTGALLARDKIDRYRPLGAFGKPTYQSHVQLRAMLLAKRGPKFANYFAKPTYEADTGELRWTAEIPGEARGWHTMPAEEQAKRALDLEVIRSGLASFAEELRAQGGAETGGSQAFASLLDQALKVPAQGDFLYLVGEQPVIAFWGFETQAGASVEPAAIAPQYPPRGFGPGVPPAAALPPSSEKRKRPWWWWLLWALLALLLLLALLWLLRACAPVPPVDEPKSPIEEPKPLVEEPKPPLEEPKPPVEEPPAVEEPKPVEEPPAEKPKPPPKKPKPPPKEGAPETKGLQPGKELQIPKGALEKGDLSFLEGLWQLGEGRLSEYKGRPDNVVASNRTVFEFGRKGGGTEHEVERRDARTGQPLPSKSSRLRVHTDGKRLYIQNDEGAKHECEVAPTGRTHCYIVNPDGHRWNAPLRRLR
jgi:hypothetical protein